MTTLADPIEAVEPKPAKPKRPLGVSAGPFTEASFARVADMLKMAAHPVRLKIITLLGVCEMNVTQMCGEFPGMSQPALSHHLALLRHSGMVDPSRRGKCIFYSLTPRCQPLADASRAIAASLSSKD